MMTELIGGDLDQSISMCLSFRINVPSSVTVESDNNEERVNVAWEVGNVSSPSIKGMLEVRGDRLKRNDPSSGWCNETNASRVVFAKWINWGKVYHALRWGTRGEVGRNGIS